jgi:predicted RNA-binding protein (virulence factor B family)
MQTNTLNRTLQDVIGSVRNAGGEVVVLIGAGCSKSAGIPLASGLIQKIRSRYPEAYARAKDKGSNVGYNAAMGELSLVERRRLLGGHIEKARINWAHLALAQLLKHEKIERVLSVNFDNLLIQASGAAGFYPPVYDLAATDRYSDKWVAKQSLLYLNGQHAGFVTLNTQAELDKHKTKLEAVVRGTGTQAVWLVIGYSGEADPLLDVLAAQEMFEGDLYWLGHSESPSEGLLKSGLLAEGKSAFYVGEQDADQALTQLAQALDCFPPEILTKPFEHIAQVVERIDFATGGEAATALQVNLHKRLEQAKEAENPSQTEQVQVPTQADAEKWLLAGQFTQVQEWYAKLAAPNDAQRDLCAWAYVMQGNAFARQAQALSAQDLPAARALWKAAGEKYALALETQKDKYEAANNWGLALAGEAQAMSAQDLPAARALWKTVGEKYALALEIKKDKHEAANNWGLALAGEAQALSAQDLPAARAMWKAAGEKYALALEIKKDKHEAAYNWGNALANEAQALSAQDLPAARALWKAAGEKYAWALEIKKDNHDAADNWSFVLLHEVQAIKNSQPEQAQKLLQKAQTLLEYHRDADAQAAAKVAYNLACVYALQGNALACVQQLEVSRSVGVLPEREHLEKDKDLDAVRESAEFQAWWAKHFPD